ncbi:MAG: cyclodeaminase/cyclohydrolase family protein [Planctomycetes bacterium]|nr:cyclodeaminase/cyclohydrolase family protein [Planctomycetota bacterium]
MSEQFFIEGESIGSFLEAAAAARPAPGGGAVAALAAALAVSMAEMALNFTVGRKKFAAVQDQAQVLLDEITGARKRLEALVEADAEAYAGVAAALKMPRATPDEKAQRSRALNLAMRGALRPPMEMLAAMREVARLLGEVLEIGNPNLSGDTAVAAAILPGAARAAALNVWQNISAFEEPGKRDLAQEVATSLAEIKENCAAVYSKVEERLCPRSQTDPTSA